MKRVQRIIIFPYKTTCKITWFYVDTCNRREFKTSSIFFPICDNDLGRSWTDMLNSVESLTNCSCFLHKQMLLCEYHAKAEVFHTIWNYIHFVEWVISLFNLQ